MGRRLRTNVHVFDEHGNALVFGPGDDVPGWVEERTTNPKAWADDEPTPEPEPEPVQPGPDVQQPRSGRGSGRDAWAAYAASRGLEVAADAERADIIAAVDEADAPEPDDL